MNNRPSHLADYGNPPLHEVVLGVQFGSPQEYKQIYAYEVWSLFKENFPKIEEHPPLLPNFETFGTPQTHRKMINFEISDYPRHDRFWFISEKGDELIQFQEDRFLHNWRKLSELSDIENSYPRFEKIIEDYQKELEQLNAYFVNFSRENLHINQCELSYVNQIHLDKNFNDKIDKWIKLITLENRECEDFSFIYKKVFSDSCGKPNARLVCEAHMDINKKNEPIILLSFTIRGLPREPSVKSAIEFLKINRENIVHCFEDITTNFAQQKWEKK